MLPLSAAIRIIAKELYRVPYTHIQHENVENYEKCMYGCGYVLVCQTKKKKGHVAKGYDRTTFGICSGWRLPSHLFAQPIYLYIYGRYLLHTFFICTFAILPFWVTTRRPSMDESFEFVLNILYLYLSKVPNNIPLTQCECRFIS